MKFVLNIGSTAVLARLLTPTDFGLFAMVASFTGFVALFTDIGLSRATVQQSNITQDQVSTLFWINVALGLGLAALCAASAPLVAKFYGEPQLMRITLAISATFIFAGLTSQHAALLQRQMRFGVLSFIDVIAMASGIAAAIVLALFHARYWALVVMPAMQSVVVLIGMWLASGWMPGRPRRGSGVIPMLKFGGNLTGFNVLNYLTRNFDNILIGDFLGAGSLGIYSKAYNLLLMPIRQISSPMGAVALPALCRLQHEPDQYRRYCLRAVKIIAFFGMPLVAFTFIEAGDLVLTLLGRQWTAAIPVFRWLAPAAFVGTLSVVPEWLCNSLGTTYRLFRWALVAVPVIIGGFAIGLKWGPAGVAASFSLTWCTSFIVLLIYSCADSPVHVSEIFLRLRSTVLASIFTALLVGIVFQPFLHHLQSPALRAILTAWIFAAVFLGVHLLSRPGRSTLREMVGIASHFRRRK
jgi:PST family polysaccharide transporter